MAIFFSHLSYNHFAGCCPKTRASNARRQLLSGHVMPLGQGLNSLDFIQTSETISTNGGKKDRKKTKRRDKLRKIQRVLSNSSIDEQRGTEK